MLAMFLTKLNLCVAYLMGCPIRGVILDPFVALRMGIQGADIINRANLGMEVMHERNAHNFPLDLAALEVPSLNG